MEKIVVTLPLLPGCDAALQAATISYEHRPDGLYVATAQAAQAQTIITNYTAANALAWAQAQQKANAAATRWAVMTGGHTTAAGIPLATDAGSITLLTGLYSTAQAGASGPFSFKDRNGTWQTLTASQVTTLFQDVSAFIQSCYTAENTLDGQINAATSWQTCLAINTGAGAFPANS